MPERATSSNRSRLLDAAVRQLHNVGYDHVTVNGLAHEAGVARGTVYAYFGDVAGVYASIWAESGEAWLRHELTRGQHEPLRAHASALPTVLLLARRVPALAEVVRPDVDRVWAEVTHDDPLAMTRAAWLLAGTLGLELVLPTAPEVAVVAGISDVIAAIPDDVVHRLGLEADPPPDLHLPIISAAQVTTDDDVASRLANADMQVIASSGLAAATMMRVCRVARLSTGAATPRFPSLQALHEATWLGALSHVVGNNTSQASAYHFPDSPAEVYAMFVRASLTPERATWRRYRQELLIAATHDPELARAMRRGLLDTNDVIRVTFEAQGNPPERVDLVIQFNLVYAVGLAALVELGVPLEKVDHRIVLRWLFDVVVQSSTAP